MWRPWPGPSRCRWAPRCWSAASWPGGGSGRSSRAAPRRWRFRWDFHVCGCRDLWPAFVGLWVGGQYGMAGDAARLFGVAMVVNSCGAPLAYRAFGEGLHRLAAFSSVTNIVVNGAVSFALAATIGFRGALYGSIAGN